MYILENISNLIEETAQFQKVVRGGKVVRKLFCPPGFKSNGAGQCVKMSPVEIVRRKKAAKLMVRTKSKTLKGIRLATMNKKRAKSMTTRHQFAR